MRKYLQEKVNAMGPMKSIKSLERAIGILSYYRRHILKVEEILFPLRQDLKSTKEGRADWSHVQGHVTMALSQSLGQMIDLMFPGGLLQSFIMETD